MWEFLLGRWSSETQFSFSFMVLLSTTYSKFSSGSSVQPELGERENTEDHVVTCPGCSSCILIAFHWPEPSPRPDITARETGKPIWLFAQEEETGFGGHWLFFATGDDPHFANITSAHIPLT